MKVTEFLFTWLCLLICYFTMQEKKYFSQKCWIVNCTCMNIITADTTKRRFVQKIKGMLHMRYWRYYNSCNHHFLCSLSNRRIQDSCNHFRNTVFKFFSLSLFFANEKMKTKWETALTSDLCYLAADSLRTVDKFSFRCAIFKCTTIFFFLQWITRSE